MTVNSVVNPSDPIESVSRAVKIKNFDKLRTSLPLSRCTTTDMCTSEKCSPRYSEKTPRVSNETDTERDMDIDNGHEQNEIEQNDSPASAGDDISDSIDNLSVMNVAPSVLMSPSRVSFSMLGLRASHSGSSSYLSSNISTNISTITPCSGMTSRQSSHNFSFKLDKIPDDYIDDNFGGSTNFTAEEIRYLKSNIFGGSFNSMPAPHPSKIIPFDNELTDRGEDDNITL
eukprot:CAMPEP_0185031084 /NCGR_PEP_ID=MMETSP1103-20130426/18362_1 /TAXON_ID=36769 /ORGANISM="Paraphysomonas bandaiensis, Strain Caron Lab Isolate" /LENGTH=228 /DNA_ID=CAMNT_0027566471 /DNA_START=107 /DNA_END=793 /DNA_ORIENTATION=+